MIKITLSQDQFLKRHCWRPCYRKPLPLLAFIGLWEKSDDKLSGVSEVKLKALWKVQWDKNQCWKMLRICVENKVCPHNPHSHQQCSSSAETREWDAASCPLTTENPHSLPAHSPWLLLPFTAGAWPHLCCHRRQLSTNFVALLL